MNNEIDVIVRRDEAIRSEMAERAARVSQMRLHNEDEFRSSATRLTDV